MKGCEATQNAHRELVESFGNMEHKISYTINSELADLRPQLFENLLFNIAVCKDKLALFVACKEKEEVFFKKHCQTLAEKKVNTEVSITHRATTEIGEIKIKVSKYASKATSIGVSFQSITSIDPQSFLNRSEDLLSVPKAQKLGNALEPALEPIVSQGSIGEANLTNYHWGFGVSALVVAIFAWSSGVTFGSGIFVGALLGSISYVIYQQRISSARQLFVNLRRAAQQDMAIVKNRWQSEIEANEENSQQELVGATSSRNESLAWIDEVAVVFNERLRDAARSLITVVDRWTIENAPGSMKLDAGPQETSDKSPSWLRLGDISESTKSPKDNDSTSSSYNSVADNLNLKVPWCFDRRGDGPKNIIIMKQSVDGDKVNGGVTVLAAQALSRFPPGTVRFVLLDPLGLGQNFSGLHALSDYDERTISNRVWSDRRHIRQQLEILVEHIGLVIQKYLRRDYESIDEYNIDAGEIAEPFRFLLVHGFPENFDSESIQALERVMANGARCGVYVILVWQTDKETPHGFNTEQLTVHARVFEMVGNQLLLSRREEDANEYLHFEFDPVPKDDVMEKIVSEYGKRSMKASRVEVHFDKILSRYIDEQIEIDEGVGRLWSCDNSRNLTVPLGPSGARKVQRLVLGESGTTAHHVLIVGRTGAGKSNLLHVLILSLAELYSPDQLSVYLVDFKKGVEFKDYAEWKLPHARVVAIESEQEFGLSVLRGIDDELRRRGELFRDKEVSELARYREKTLQPLPRIVLIVDEFHELFLEEGAASREVSTIIERLVRQGRSFGIHIVLSSQSISGVRLPRSILDQIGVRIALQCSEADSHLVLADDNGAARLLERAGEAIYNDKNGLIEGNNSFQVALLPESSRKAMLADLRDLAVQKFAPDADSVVGPYIFEDSEAAEFGNCRAFRENVGIWPTQSPNAVVSAWVGEPIAMRPAHSMVFKRQSGANILVIERNEELGFAVILNTLVSAAVQESPNSIVFRIVDLSAADSQWADLSETFKESFPHDIQIYDRKQVDDLISTLASECDNRSRSENRSNKRAFFAFFGLQRARNLRREEGFRFSRSTENTISVHDSFSKILREGPDLGIHTAIWCDTLQNLLKILDSSDLNEIGQRVSGPLAQADSTKLFDDIVAAKINKENRLVCYDDELVGAFTFVRPFRSCPQKLLREIGKELCVRWDAVLDKQRGAVE